MESGYSDIKKLVFDKGEELVSSYVYLEGVNYDNLECAVSGTENIIRQGTDAEVLGITHEV